MAKKPMSRKAVKESWSKKYLQSDKRVKMTLKQMALWGSLLRLDSERTINRKTMKQMLTDAENGDFIWEVVTVVLVQIKTNTYMVNASHTFKMLAAAHITNFKPTLRVLTYKMPNIKMAKKFWSAIDRGMRRTKAQRLVGMLLGTRGYELPSITRTVLTKIQRGMNWFLAGSNSNTSTDLPVELLHTLLEYGGKYHRTAMAVRDILMAGWSPGAVKTGSVAAMIATIEADPKNAPKFWREVFSGESDDEICQILHNNLVKLVIPNNRNVVTEDKLDGTAQIQANSEQVYGMCIELWNCWCTGTLPPTVEVLIKLVTAAPARAKIRVRVGTRRRNKVLKK